MSGNRENRLALDKVKSVKSLLGVKGQGVTLALACSPRRVSKVSGERKSLITHPFGEYDFRCQEIIQIAK